MTNFKPKRLGKPPQYDFVLSMAVGDTRIIKSLGSRRSDKAKYRRVYMALRYYRPRLGNKRFRIEIGTMGTADRHKVARITRVK